MYVKSAAFYDDLYDRKDYQGEVEYLAKTVKALHPTARTLLDVACSTGRHLEFLSAFYDVEGLDINVDLLAVARGRLPSVPLHHGDMMDFTLGRTFDVVTCLFASIAYSGTVENLIRAICNFTRHLNPGGVLIVEPWVSPERYWRNHVVMNISKKPQRTIAWGYVGEEKDRIVTNNVNLMVATPEGVSHFVETHKMGLFTQDDYLTAIASAALSFVRYDPRGLYYGLYIARQE